VAQLDQASIGAFDAAYRIPRPLQPDTRFRIRHIELTLPVDITGRRMTAFNNFDTVTVDLSSPNIPPTTSSAMVIMGSLIPSSTAVERVVIRAQYVKSLEAAVYPSFTMLT
jgi:hypothetical protein